MSGWTTVEVHCFNGEFSDEGSQHLKERIETICGSVVYDGNKRIVGVMNGYNRYPDKQTVENLSAYDGVGVVVCEANDTSDTGTTELFIDGEIEEEYTGDRYCHNAMRELKEQYGIYVYANYYWCHINCSVDVWTDDRYERDRDGYVSVRNSVSDDYSMEITVCETEGEDEDHIDANLTEKEAEQLVREIQTRLDSEN